MTQKQEHVYIARVFKLNGKGGAENFENLLNGREEAFVHEVNTGNLLSNPQFLDTSKMSESEKETYLKNSHETMTSSSYFMIAPTLSELNSNIETLMLQPVSEDAYERVSSGDYSKSDIFANNIVSIVVMKVDSSVMDNMIQSGNAIMYEGKYGVDHEQQLVDEIVIGSTALSTLVRSALNSNSKATDLVVYDEVFSGLQILTEGNANPLFKSKYTPSITFGTTKAQENTTTSEYDAAKAWIEGQKANGMSDEDIALLMSALNGEDFTA